MSAIIGNLNIGGRDHDILRADCTLFVGRVTIDFATSEFEGSVANIPVGDVVDFAELAGDSITLSGCCNAVYDNSLFKPTLGLQAEYSPIDQISLDSIEITDCGISFSVVGAANADQDELPLSFRGNLKAECLEFDRFWLLNTPQPIPIRFAQHYLPMIGAHPFQSGATLEDVVCVMGHTDDAGGGNHPKFGTIPQWVRYTLPEYYLRFEIVSDVVTNVTVMNRNSMIAG